MDELMRFETADGTPFMVAVEDQEGSYLVSRGDPAPNRVARTFEASLAGVRAAAQSALSVFRDGHLAPDSVEIEFGVKLTAETGAILVKGSGEGHLVVKLGWSAEQPAAAAPPPPAGPAPSADPADPGPSADPASPARTPSSAPEGGTPA